MNLANRRRATGAQPTPSRQVFHQLDELLPASSLPFDDLLAVALLLFFGITTLKVRAAACCSPLQPSAILLLPVAERPQSPPWRPRPALHPLQPATQPRRPATQLTPLLNRTTTNVASSSTPPGRRRRRRQGGRGEGGGGRGRAVHGVDG
jgi:hypothetical protein